MKFRSVSSSCSSSTGDLLWKLKHTWNSSVLDSAWSSAPFSTPFSEEDDIIPLAAFKESAVHYLGPLSVIIWNNWSGSVLCCCRLSSNFLTYFFTQVLLKRVFENFSFMIPQLFCFHYIHFKTLVSIRCADFTYFFPTQEETVIIYSVCKYNLVLVTLKLW